MSESEHENQDSQYIDINGNEKKRKYAIWGIIFFIIFVVASKIIINEILARIKPELAPNDIRQLSGINNEIEFYPDDVFVNSIGMKLVYIPAGDFLMGSSESKAEVTPDEVPEHLVRISKDFRMGIYEVTQKQYQEIMGNNPSKFKGDDLPVECVSWDDANDFCKKLSEREGKKYRLPTEAEWEYACSAGSQDDYYFGDNDSLLSSYAWYVVNSGDTTHPVGQKTPNKFGLYDMHGNVQEWCYDWYHNRFYKSSNTNLDPVNKDSGFKTFRIVRGGSWKATPLNCHCEFRYGLTPTNRFSSTGFRVVLELE